MEAGGIDAKGLDGGKHHGTTHGFSHRGEVVEHPAKPVVVQQHGRDGEDLGQRGGRGPAGHVVQRRGRGQPVGYEGDYHLGRGQLGAAVLGQVPAHDPGQAQALEHGRHHQQRAHVPALAHKRRVKTGQGPGQGVELSRRLQLVFPAQVGHHPLAGTASFPVRLHQFQVAVGVPAPVDLGPLDVHVVRTLAHLGTGLQACKYGPTSVCCPHTLPTRDRPSKTMRHGHQPGTQSASRFFSSSSLSPLAALPDL